MAECPQEFKCECDTSAIVAALNSLKGKTLSVDIDASFFEFRTVFEGHRIIVYVEPNDKLKALL